MGNAAAKVGSASLSKGSMMTKASYAISPSLISSESLTAKNKFSSKKWINASTDETLFAIQKKGMIKSHSIIIVGDSSEEEVAVAYVVTVKKCMTGETCYICKTIPSFEGQEALTEEQLKKAGIESNVVIYAFAKLQTTRTMTTAKCTYSKIIGKAEGEEEFAAEMIYAGEKLSAMGFQALFKESGGTVVAKAATKGMSFTPELEFAEGVDVPAVILIGYSLNGDANAAGAMAGAGIV